MITGIETAGLVLAILPLIVSTLENQKKAIAPFKSLLKYAKFAQQAGQEFGIASCFLSQTLQLIANDCGLTAREYNALMRRSIGQDLQSDSVNSEAAKKLTAYFGEETYDTGIYNLLQKILKNVTTTCDDLGLELTAQKDDAQTLWKAITAAKARLDTPALETLKHIDEFKRRLRLFIKSGTLESRCDEIKSDVQELLRMRDNARDLGTATSHKIKFAQDLSDIQKHAESLHKALWVVSSCAAHSEHSVGLQLERRLDKDLSMATGTTSTAPSLFNMALAQDENSRHWHSFGVDMAAHNQRSLSGIQQASGCSLAAFTPWQTVTECLCKSFSRSLDLKFGIDSEGQMNEKPAEAPGESVTLLSSVTPKPIKELLDQVHGDPPESIMTFQTAIELGLTITSSFLQLYDSDWVKDMWSTRDIIALLPQSPVIVDPVYIRLSTSLSSVLTGPDRSATNPKSATGDSSSTRQASNHGARLLALAAIILELGLDKRFEDLKGVRDGPGTFHTIRRCLAQRGFAAIDEASPCFREAAEFCRDNYQKDLHLSQDLRVQEIADGLVYPFLRDLRHSQQVTMPNEKK